MKEFNLFPVRMTKDASTPPIRSSLRAIMRSLILILSLLIGTASIWAETVTYSVTKKDACTVTGNAPEGSSATYSQTYNTAAQATANNSLTLKLSGYAGYKITGISLSMKSNKSGGKGSLSVVAGTTTIASIDDAAFNTSSWYESWSQDYVDVTPSMSNDSYEIQENEDVTFNIAATANSLYCQSYTITYEDANATCETLSAPTNPASTPSQTSVELNWDAVAGAEGYKVVFNGIEYNIAAGTTTKTIDELAMETEYKWTVAAKGDGTTYCPSGMATAQQSVTTLDACTGNKAVYTVASSSSVTQSGALEGSSATFANTYTSNKEQMTKNNSQTLTLSGYDGATIKGLTLSMRSNGNAGAGTFSLKIGETTIAELSSAPKFNTWFDNDSYGTTYRNVHVTFENDVVVGTDEDIVVTIAATENSLYCQSFTFCYEEPAAAAVEKPALSLATGTYLGAQNVTITCATTGADIYYTLDGTDPTSSSTAYTGTISITETKTLKAIAIKGSDESAIASATYTIVTTEHAGTETDPYSVADAKIIIDAIGTKTGVYVSGIVSQIVTAYNASHGNISFNLSADGATSGPQIEAYRCKSFNGDAFTSADDVVVGATVTVYGDLKKFSSTYELDANCQLAAYEAPTTPKTSIANTKATAYTVAQALTYAADALSYDLTDPVYIVGEVYKVENFNSTNGTLDIYVKDADADNEFEFFRCKGIYDESLTAFTAADDVRVGDEVIGYGVMKHFTNSTTDIWEFDNNATGDYLVSLERPTIVVTGVTLENTASVAIGKTVTLHATVAPDNANNKTINWSVTSGSDKASVADGVVTGIAEGTAVIRAASDEDASIFAECTVTVLPLSPWATTYTSNVPVVHTGSGVDNGTITIGTDNPYTLVKAGASSATGTIKVTVPVGATDLHFHAFAWGGKTATIEISGVDNASQTEFKIAGESGASGSGNDFTLAGDPVDQYFHVSFDAVAAETEIVFSKTTTSADNRFFFYGVNQEGGVLPELQSIEISGDLTKKSGYKAGDALDIDGLSVLATYTLGGTPQEPVDVTEDVEWSYDALVEGQESVTITAAYEGKTDDIEITLDEAVASADPKIYVDKLSVNFGTVAPNAASVEDKKITVTLTNVAAATATLGGTNPEAFSITPSALDASGDITISVVSTATIGTYSATITISDNAETAESKVVNLSLTVEDVETPVSTTSQWVVATEITDGMQVLIVGVKNDATYAAGLQKSNNRGAVAGSLEAGVFTPGEGTMSFTLVATGEADTYYIKSSNGKYLYNASTSNNSYLRLKDSQDDASWTITLSGENAVITSVENTNRTLMRFNKNGNNDPLFCCYASGQDPIQLYVPKAEEPVEPDYGSYTRNVTSGNYGTICLPKTGTISGATLFDIASYENEMIYVDEVSTGVIEAGKPYIFQATDNQLNVTYTSATAVEAGQANGLHGYYDLDNMTADEDAQKNLDQDAGNYILYQNQYWLVSGRDAYVNNFRAYIKIAEINNVAPAPGRRRIAMAVNGAQTATGIDALNASEKPVKVMSNGQFFILRGEKLYDATGRLVK